MVIALSYAMTEEIASLLADRREAFLLSIAGVKFYSISDNIIAYVGGMGKVNSALATQICIDRFNPDLIINVGVVGSFINVPIGTLIVPYEFIQHDVDISGLGYTVGQLDRFSSPELDVSDFSDVEVKLKGLNIEYIKGIGVTGDWFSKKGSRSDEVRSVFNPTFIDMEGGSIAQVCILNGVRFASLKSVSDCIYGDSNFELNLQSAVGRLNDLVLRMYS